MLNGQTAVSSDSHKNEPYDFYRNLIWNLLFDLCRPFYTTKTRKMLEMILIHVFSNLKTKCLPLI